MIILKRNQFENICPKEHKLGQAEWFRNKYGCTLIIHGSKYILEFKTDKEETFFKLQYSEII